MSLGVPPRAQQALLRNGFDSFERISEAVGSMTEAGAWAEQLGLPPAAEVLLRRLRDAATETQKVSSGEEQIRPEAIEGSDAPDKFISATTGFEFKRKLPVKRFRLPKEGAAE